MSLHGGLIRSGVGLSGCKQRRLFHQGTEMNDEMTPDDAAELASHHIGKAFHLNDRFDLGAEGAYRATVGGAPRVFKYWSGNSVSELRLATAVAAHAVLHHCGWPLPPIHFWH